MFAHTDELGIPEGIRIVETLNGGSKDDEDQITKDSAAANGYQGIGGSDSHHGVTSRTAAAHGLKISSNHRRPRARVKKRPV